MIGLSLILSGCEDESSNTHHAKMLRIDDRYKREVTFDFIGVTIALEKPETFVRIDGPVLDIDRHTQDILQELEVLSRNITYENPAEAYAGQHMHLSFDDGKKCSFIWFAKCPDDRLTHAVTEHEKFHALSHISPSGIIDLSNAIRQKGFNINLGDYDEELSATIVQVLSLYLQGIPFEQLSGSEIVNHAKQILVDNMSNKRTHSIAGSACSE